MISVTGKPTHYRVMTVMTPSVLNLFDSVPFSPH
jgi:hypothetical protein